MINSKYDLLFCKKSIELLNEEISRPQIYWMNDFHTTKTLKQDAILKIIFDFINS